MSSSAVESKKSFLCCPAPFGACCGGQKSRKTSPPINDVKNDVKNQNNDDKKDELKTNGENADPKNPFLTDNVENEEIQKNGDDKDTDKGKGAFDLIKLEVQNLFLLTISRTKNLTN